MPEPRTSPARRPLRTQKFASAAFVVCAIWPLIIGILWVTTNRTVPLIKVRWVPGVADEKRSAAERALSLAWRDSTEPRTVTYFLMNSNTENVRRIVQHPLVEDTAFIDRAAYALSNPPRERTWAGDRFATGWPSALLYASLLGCLLSLLVSAGSSAHRRQARYPGLRPLLLCILWLGAFVFTVSSFVFHNDHFDRISRARQIARYGEWPFRDFFDPGYYLTEFVSAGLQLLLGDSLLGDVLLSSICIATGSVLVARLSLHVSQSLITALAASVLALLALPRGYDFDKVLFYPLAVALCWRYVDLPAATRVWAVAAGVVVAALFRYDTGVYTFGAAVVAFVAVHAGDWQTLGRRLGLLAAAIACLSLPVLILLQLTAGLSNVVDQVVTYGIREGAGTRVAKLPALAVNSTIGLSALSPPSRKVTIRWQSSIDSEARQAAEARHALVDGMARGAAQDRTWAYRIKDSSAGSLQALIEDPAVEDVGGIDKRRVRLTPEPWWTRTQRAIPLLRLRAFPGAWTFENANALLYYLFLALPLAGILVMTMKGWSQSASRNEIAKVASLIVLCIVLNLVILRYPVAARVGGMIGPAAILAAWMCRSVWQVRHLAARLLLRAAAVVVLGLFVWSVSTAVMWQERLTRELASPSRFTRVIRTVAASPPDADLIGRPYTTLALYLRECTRPADRILTTFFAPEIAFFAQRGFAGGLATLFGGHWSESRFQQRSLQSLTANPPALIIERSLDTEFRQAYPLLAGFVSDHYRWVGTTESLAGPGPESLVLLVRNDREASTTHSASSLPCFR